MGKFKVLAVFFPLFFFNLFHVATAGDTVTLNQSIFDGQTLISSEGAFELGFFSPGGSKGRYVGIWYKNIPVQTVVWVANRETPITGSLGVLHLNADGNLALHDHTGNVLWSTGTSGVSDPSLRLLDSGNLVLNKGSYDGSKSPVWQSFDYPSDTQLPGMKLGWDLRTNLSRRLTSWKSTSDPSLGTYSLGMDLRGSPEMYLWNGSAPESRSGPWDGQSWGGAAPMKDNEIFSFHFISTQDEVYYQYETVNKSIIARLVMNQLGMVQRLLWLSGSWRTYWSGPRDLCAEYAQCGPYGVCNIEESPICRCLRGFVPKSPEHWNQLRDGSDGCLRRTALNCPVGDGFLKVTLKLPDTSNATVGKDVGLDECRDGCSRNCSCTAFAFLSGGSGCITWHGDLVDIRELSLGGGDDLYVRLAASELEVGSKRHVLIIVTVTTSLALLALSSIICIVWMRKHRHKGMMEDSAQQSLFTLGTSLASKLGENTERNSEFSLLHFSSIIYATNNFSNANKLGQGGFGPVYKGQLPEGQEIAVKRLAAHSGQGLEEFKNEILLISKLQHRNLVKLLGYCIHGEEKILIYEYMTNKSLDFFLFDLARRAQLDWGKRFHIIEGIAQGLLYLHKHSRLRIIHRDLKVSNILLDAEMNPKISDFGMARIFGSNETQANTQRVVGTYGYMSPEYAAEGLFSIKSDVFSFGVIILEIVSGQRNVSFHQNGNSLNLLGYAWELWKEAKWLEFVDPLFDDRCPTSQISRCIHVALLCVQESAVDRPTMSDAIVMLSSESAALPDPKQPAFFNIRVAVEGDFPSNAPEICSLNVVTFTIIDGR